MALSLRAGNVKLLKENIGEKLHDIDLSKDLLDRTPKIQATKAKIDKWGYSKLKSFCTVKERIRVKKKTYGMRENTGKPYLKS